LQAGKASPINIGEEGARKLSGISSPEKSRVPEKHPLGFSILLPLFDNNTNNNDRDKLLVSLCVSAMSQEPNYFC